MKKTKLSGIVPALIVLALLIAFGTYLYFQHTAPAGTISFETRTTFDGLGTTTLPYITKSDNPLIAARINHEIDKIAQDSCVTGLFDEDLRDSLTLIHPEQSAAASKMSRADLIKALGWQSYTETNSTYAQKGLFSFSYLYGYDCGAAHPSSGDAGLIYDMKTGTSIDDTNMYENFDAHKVAIEKILYQAYKKSYEAEVMKEGTLADARECEASLNPDGGDPQAFDYASYYVTDAGLIMIPSVGADQPCGDDTPVSIAALKPYLAKGSPLLGLIK